MAQQSTEVKALSGLRPWIIATAIFFPLLSWFTNEIMIGMTTWWNWPAILPLPIPVTITLFYLLSKISPRFKISAQEWGCLLTIMWLTAGTTWAENNVPYWTIVPLPTYNYARLLEGFNTEPYKSVYLQKIPSLLAPKNPAVLNAFYLGGVFDVSAWIGPLSFWVIWAIVLYCGSYLWTYPLRKPLIEAENLPFPWALPSAYAVVWNIEEDHGKPSIFSFKLIRTKLFWIGLLIGILIYVPNSLSALTPIPLPTYINVIPWDFNPVTMGVLPGAEFNSYLPLADAIASSLLPLDVLATCIVDWVVLGVIYPVIGVRTGLLPYTPGNEYGVYDNTIGPFKREIFGQYGIPIGLGVWAIYHYRKYFVNMIRGGLQPSKYPELKEEDGVPSGLVAIGGIVFFFLLAMLFVAGGVPIIMALVGPAFYIVLTLGWVMLASQAPVGYASSYHGLNLSYYFDMGTGLGQWGPRPDPNAFNAMQMWASFGSGSRMASYAAHGQFLSYKMGSMTKTRGRDILYISIITMVSIAVCSQTLWPWFTTVFGGKNRLGTVDYQVWDIGGVWQLSNGSPPTIGPAETWMYAILGILVTFACFILRARFAWFFLNPIGFQLGGPAWSAIWLIGFLIKWISLRIGGSRAWENYTLPTVVGIALGNGMIYIITAFIAFFTRGLPTLMTF